MNKCHERAAAAHAAGVKRHRGSRHLPPPARLVPTSGERTRAWMTPPEAPHESCAERPGTERAHSDGGRPVPIGVAVVQTLWLATPHIPAGM